MSQNKFVLPLGGALWGNMYTSTSLLIESNHFIDHIFWCKSLPLALLDLIRIPTAIGDKIGKIKHLKSIIGGIARRNPPEELNE
jgi:hypothetical protein